MVRCVFMWNTRNYFHTNGGFAQGPEKDEYLLPFRVDMLRKNVH